MPPTEQIKSRLDVATLIQSYCKLEKAGANYKARCPFHSEKTASFYVSPARDMWHCFGCGKGGDIFKFVMEMEGIEFPEALKMLAERAGVELKREIDTGARSLRAKLFALLEDATQFFEHQLANDTGAREYLRERAISEESVKKFRLGFAPDGWRIMSDILKRKGYTDAEIEKAGLAIQGSKGLYDRFRSRIIFPLEDSLGRVIGFGGRIYPPHASSAAGSEEAAKYINTPQTPLYDKSRFLYGLSKAKNGIRQEKRAVVVEGYMDCILSHQAGVEETVAVSGTALTEAHLEMLKRLSDALVFSFDVDRAGIDASRRAVELAFAKNFHVRLVDIKGGKDPADIVAQDADAWKGMVRDARDSISFFLDKAVGTLAPSSPQAKKKIGEDILPLIARLSSEIEKAHWICELAHILKISEDALWRELARSVRIQQWQDNKDIVSASPEPEVVERTRKGRLEEHIAGLVLLEPNFSLLGDLPEKIDCSLLATGELFQRLRERAFQGIKEEFFESLPEDLRHDAGRYMLEAEVFFPDVIAREGEFVRMLHAWKELSLKEKLSQLQNEIKELEVLGRKDDLQRSMERFQELARSLTYHSHTYEKKEKNKENT